LVHLGEGSRVGGDVDDPAVTVLEHLWDGGGAAAPGADDVGVQGGDHAFHVGRRGRGVAVYRDGCVVDQHVWAAVGEGGVGDGACDAGRVGDVELTGRQRAILTGQFSRSCLGRVDVAGGDHYVKSLVGQPSGDAVA